MLSLDKIVGINIEVSSLCNGKCPFCSRGRKAKPYDSHVISFEDFKKLPPSMFEHIGWMSFSGNFGDFSSNREMPQIVEYVKQLNPSIVLYGDSNGSAQNTDWWGALGAHFKDGEMYFALDGLADTHSIHRRGTNFDKIINNVRAFTETGGVAFWKFILFKHNEHQVDEAQKLAEEIGCSRFLVVSSREYNEECLRPEKTKFELKHEIFTKYGTKSSAEGGQAICKPLANKSIYIAADGTVHPCCLTHCNYISEQEPSFRFVIPLIEEHIEQINFMTKPLDEIIAGPYFAKIVELSKNNKYCMAKCNKYRKEAQQELILRDVSFDR